MRAEGYSHDGPAHPWVAAHPQVVIAAPHGHLLFGDERVRIVICHGEDVCPPVHSFKNPIGVVIFLLINFLLKETIILKSGNS